MEKTQRHKEFFEVSDELYAHEQPFYSACARGGHFVCTPEWERKRAELTQRYMELCPYRTYPEIRPLTFWQKVKRLFS